MIDLKRLRADPERFKRGARDKGVDVDIERLLKLDEQRRTLIAEQETKRAEQKKLSKEIGPQIGSLAFSAGASTGRARSRTMQPCIRPSPCSLALLGESRAE